jgi:c-di-GMP-related signal transduction protein
VETHDEFEAAREMGFELFQGYFFCKPEIIRGHEIQGSQLNLMMIMAQINSDSFNCDELEKLIVRDMGISYKLFKYLNSVFFARVSKVSSVKQALVFLGEKEIRRFVSLMPCPGWRKASPRNWSGPPAFVASSANSWALTSMRTHPPSEMFTLGLFSLIDAVMDHPMDRILGELPLSAPIKRALVDAKGPLAGYIELVRSYETGRWDRVARLSRALNLNEKTLPGLYLQACKWSDIAAKAS